MQIEVTIRTCSTCSTPLPFNEDKMQEGFICCDEYFCNEECLLGTRVEYATHREWSNEHYSDDCYWTEWELEETKEDLCTI